MSFSIKDKSVNKMDKVNVKNNKPAMGQKNPCYLANKIYNMLNQGSLYEIHQELQDLKNEHDRKCLIKVFVEKFNFNFIKYI